MNLSVHASVFPPAETRAHVSGSSDTLPYLTISGPDLRLSLHTIDPADPEYLAFARSLRDAAEQFVRAYESTFLTAPDDDTASAA